MTKPIDIEGPYIDAQGTPFIKVYFAYEGDAERWANKLDFETFGGRRVSRWARFKKRIKEALDA